MSEIRVGLVGYGVGGAYFHAPLIHAADGLTLSAVVTRDPGRADDASARYGAAAVPEVEALWGRCDLVVVASPNRTHVPIATEALRRGVPVVIDKPVARTAEEARELVRLARERGIMLTVFQNRRWDGDYLTLRSLIDGGALGEVFRFESRFERWRPEPKGGWRESGGADEVGGLLYDLGSHLVDQAMQLFGPVREVYAHTDVRRPGVHSDDDTFVALTHAGGTRSQLWVSAVTARPGPRFRVLGSLAAYQKHGLDVQEERLRDGLSPTAAGFGEEPEDRWGTLGAGDRHAMVPTLPGRYLDFYQGVAACLRDGAAPPVEPESAAEALVVIEAARRSAAEGTVVRLP